MTLQTSTLAVPDPSFAILAAMARLRPRITTQRGKALMAEIKVDSAETAAGHGLTSEFDPANRAAIAAWHRVWAMEQEMEALEDALNVFEHEREREIEDATDADARHAAIWA